MLRLKALKDIAVSSDPSCESKDPGLSLRIYMINTKRQPGDNVNAAYWTAAECNVAIICASLPYLRPLIIRVFPRFASNLSYPRKSDGYLTSTRRKSKMTIRDNTQGDHVLRSFNDRPDAAASRGTLTGIQVTTELIQETTKGADSLESTSQRRLVIDV